MKKLIASLIISLSVVSFALGQSGDWSGKLNVNGNALILVFHLSDENCTMDSPDQGIKDIPASLERTSTGIKVSIPSINASYEGFFMGKTVSGTFTQHGRSFPLTLIPGIPKRNRPQTPVGPFPYKTEEMSFSNGDAVLKGTLALPEKYDRNTPVLIMVTGSGLQNRDEEIFEHKPFAVIADALARHGFASLRYDDRGFGDSTGDLVYATTEDFKNDALAGIELLRERFCHVGVLGHSEGGTIGLMLAAEKKVDFVVSLAGAVVSGKQILLEQNRWALLQAGYSEDITKNYCRVLEGLFDDIETGITPKLNVQDLPPELENNLKSVWTQANTPYMRYFLSMDISSSLADITCPVLALNGTKDRQVDCEENLGALREGLAGAKRIVPVKGVNHLFQHCDTGDVSEYKEIEETIAPEVLETIVAWLKELYTGS